MKRTARQAHTEGCRKRFESELHSIARSAAVERKTNEYLEKAVRMEEEKRSVMRKVKDNGADEETQEQAKDDIEMEKTEPEGDVEMTGGEERGGVQVGGMEAE